MNKKVKRVLIYSILTLLAVGIVVFFVLLFHKSSVPPKQLTLFYSDQCPHCQNVEAFIQRTQAMSKINLQKKEVAGHINEIMAVAKTCRLDLQRLQIPLLWTGQQCVIGDKPVVNYLKNELNSHAESE